MNELIECLSGLQGRIGTCVCLGVGSPGAALGLAALLPVRLVLADGEPLVAEALREQAAAWPGAEVHGVTLAPTVGSVDWHRYNLPAFNGLRDATALARYFPRLKAAGTTRVEAVNVGRWLASLGVTPAAADRSNLLVLALPGQERALLEAIPADTLELFDVVAFEGCTDPGYGGDSTPDVLVTVLRERGYACVGKTEGQALWSAAVTRLDRREAHLSKLERRIRELDEELLRVHREASDRINALQSAQAQAGHLAAERQLQVEQLTLARAAAEQAALERQAQLESLGHAKAAAEDRAAELQAQVQQQAEARAAAEQAAQARQAQVESVEQAREAAANRAAELQAQVHQQVEARAAADQAAQALQAQVGTLVQARATAESRAAELQAQVQQQSEARAAAEHAAQALLAQVESLEQARATAESRAAELQAQVQQQSEARAAAEHAAQALLAQIESLEQARAAAESRAAELKAQVQQQSEARAAAEHAAQALLAQVESLEQARAAAESRAAELQAQVQQQSEARAEAERAAQALLAQVESLEQARAAAESRAAELRAQVQKLCEAKALAEAQRDEETKWHHENSRWARGLKAELEAFQAAAEGRAAELQAQVAQHAEARIAAERRATQLEAQVQQLGEAKATAEAQRDEERKWHHENARWARGLKTELEALQAAHASLRAQADRVAADAASGEGGRHTIAEELTRTRRAFDIAVRTHALREGDLRDLQERYARLSCEHQETRELLSRLAQRLMVAQDYFRRLALPDGAVPHGAGRAPIEPVDALGPVELPDTNVPAKPKAASRRRKKAVVADTGPAGERVPPAYQPRARP
jgi:chromosome segregation ATPase